MGTSAQMSGKGKNRRGVIEIAAGAGVGVHGGIGDFDREAETPPLLLHAEPLDSAPTSDSASVSLRVVPSSTPGVVMALSSSDGDDIDACSSPFRPLCGMQASSSSLRICSPTNPHLYRRIILLLVLVLTTILASGLNSLCRIKPFRTKRQGNTSSKSKKKKPIKTIRLIGEHHSGTNWIFNHLKECFRKDLKIKSSLSRYKHWFQYDDPDKVIRKSLVIAQFRNPHEWTDAMRQKPWHFPMHWDHSNSGSHPLDWMTFVTRPWTMPRDEHDLKVQNESGRICQHSFRYNEVNPCLEKVFKSSGHAIYELRNDMSGEPYDSIIDMRRDKIRNFFNVSSFDGVVHFLPVQYEDFVSNGTAALIAKIESLAGVTARCSPLQPQNYARKELDPKFIRWMNENVDWETERLIGYGKWV